VSPFEDFWYAALKLRHGEPNEVQELLSLPFVATKRVAALADEVPRIRDKEKTSIIGKINLLRRRRVEGPPI